jgi:hypothetical protein
LSCFSFIDCWANRTRRSTDDAHGSATDDESDDDDEGCRGWTGDLAAAVTVASSLLSGVLTGNASIKEAGEQPVVLWGRVL